MGMIGELWRKLRYTAASRTSVDTDLAQEIEFHIATRAEELEREGVPAAEAHARARREFGPPSRIGEDSREAWQFAWMEQVASDVRYSIRTLRRNPLFTTVAVLSLALGIGANTAVFTLLDQLVLRLLPVKDPRQLVMIWSTGPHVGNNEGDRSSSYPMYEDFQRRSEAFESVFCRYATPLAVTVDGSTERVSAELVSGNYFDALRVKPALGRVFSPESDDRTYKGHPVVVLSHDYWVNRFGGDPNIVGRKILVNRYPMEIVGVSAAEFSGLDPAEAPQIRVPIQMKPLTNPGRDDLGNRRSQWVQMFARMKPGFTVASARASLQPLFHHILEEETRAPEIRRISPYDRDLFLKRTVRMETAANGYSNLREQYSTALLVLMGMAGLILLIACSNVANLLIARAVARQREIAVRLAIGAGRRKLIRHLLVESLVLSLMGAAFGLALAVVATRGLIDMLPADKATLMLRPEPDLRVLLFSTAVALATALLFGLAPALQATRFDVWTTLKNAGGATAGGDGAARLRKGLVTAQVALSFLLLAGAGLFARTLLNLKNTHTGFERIGNLVSFRVDPARSGYDMARIRSFYENLLQEVRAAPGVKSAAYAMNPLLSGREWDTYMTVEGHRAKDGEDMQAYYNAVSPGYWQAMGVPLLAGRDFEERDRFDNTNPNLIPTVAIVNRKFAEHFFGKASPIGRHVGVTDRMPTNIAIVGMVENSLFDTPREGVRRQVFVSHSQMNFPDAATYYIRTNMDSKALFPILRSIVAKRDVSIPLYDTKTLQTQLDETLSTERLIAWLSVAFGILATIMAALGLYGVMAFVVVRRTRELGLRMALGAPRGAVLWLVLREVFALAGVGLAVGVPCAYLLSRYVSSQLFGVQPTDVWTGAAAIGVLGLVAAISGYLPARRASSIDPTTALRYE